MDAQTFLIVLLATSEASANSCTFPDPSEHLKAFCPPPRPPWFPKDLPWVEIGHNITEELWDLAASCTPADPRLPCSSATTDNAEGLTSEYTSDPDPDPTTVFNTVSDLTDSHTISTETSHSLTDDVDTARSSLNIFKPEDTIENSFNGTNYLGSSSTEQTNSSTIGSVVYQNVGPSNGPKYGASMSSSSSLSKWHVIVIVVIGCVVGLLIIIAFTYLAVKFCSICQCKGDSIKVMPNISSINYLYNKAVKGVSYKSRNPNKTDSNNTVSNTDQKAEKDQEDVIAMKMGEMTVGDLVMSTSNRIDTFSYNTQNEINDKKTAKKKRRKSKSPLASIKKLPMKEKRKLPPLPLKGKESPGP